MTTQMPEIFEMFEAAQRYLNGEIGLSWLHGYIAQCENSSAVQMDSETREMVRQWRFMIENTWNEWGINNNPVSESDFKTWIKAHLP